MNKLAEMQCFVVTVDTGSISEAARRLGTAKSVVSQRIRQLEKRLGIIFFDRGRQVSPTEAGKVFYQHCVRILADVEHAEEAILAFTSELSGNLRLSAPMAFSSRYLTQILSSFALRYPSLRLDIEYDDRYVNLQEENFDAAIRIGELPDSSLVARSIAGNRHLICASPGYIATHGAPQTPEELAEHHALLYVHREPHGMWALPVGNLTESFRVRSRMRTNNGFQLLEGAKAGMGLAILPTFLAVDAIVAGELQIVLTSYEPRGGNISLVYRQSQRTSPKMEALSNFLIEQIGSPPIWEQQLTAYLETVS
ncbi:LysR family transcriptional regulator [Pseudomonas sp. OST1909]|uniref:LysR family transcriptional regulator n=1 Tax=Pseudomonas sp. OST1909 TaxID=2777367 RepID=UPI001889C177|nr:LysR family transcriptional regulator [Pseudomonas sp. OST1909]QOY69151.1 LysR family transcriptional regulator [Pseudomonas sp. OST1909]